MWFFSASFRSSVTFRTQECLDLVRRRLLDYYLFKWYIHMFWIICWKLHGYDNNRGYVYLEEDPYIYLFCAKCHFHNKWSRRFLHLQVPLVATAGTHGQKAKWNSMMNYGYLYLDYLYWPFMMSIYDGCLCRVLGIKNT